MKKVISEIERLEYRVETLYRELEDMKKVISDQTIIIGKMVDYLVELTHQENTAVGYQKAYEDIVMRLTVKSKVNPLDLGKPMKENEGSMFRKNWR